MKDRNPITLVVSEQGGRRPALVAGPGHQVLAVHQQDGELLAALTTRVSAAADLVKLQGGTVERAYLVCNGRTDGAALVARLLMATTLIAALCAAGGGQIVLSTDPSFNDQARPHLLGLAEALVQLTRDPRIEVRSSFDAPSGVLGSARRAPAEAPRGAGAMPA